MPYKVCKTCGNDNSKKLKNEYIIPDSYKERNNKIKADDFSLLSADKKKYIKPSRLQIFNDEFNDDSNNNQEEDLNFNESNNTIINESQIQKMNINNNDYENIVNEIPSITVDNPQMRVKKNKKTKRSVIFNNLEEVLPKEVSGEIIVGKFKGIIKVILGIMGIIYGILSIWYNFFLEKHPDELIHSFNTMFISFTFGIIILVLSVFLSLFGFFQYNNFRMYSNKYNKEFSNNELTSKYPPFLKEIYIKRIQNRYYIILLAGCIYTSSLVIIPILYLIQKFRGKDFSFAWWKIGQTPNVHDVIVGFWAIIIIATFILMLNILINERRHSILNIYTSNSVLTEEEKTKISKATKKKCIIIYLIVLSVLLVIFVIPFIVFLVKKLKTKK